MSTIVTDAVTALSGNLALLPEGSGVVTIDGLTYPAADGSAGQAIVTNASGVLSFASVGGGLQSRQIFTSSGTWTKPSGITLVKVIVTGGGGGGGDGNSSNAPSQGGSAGGTSIEFIDVSSISSETVTIGAAGTRGSGGSGGNGGSSSFGSLCSATGGTGGGASNSVTYMAPGVGSGGDINLKGGVGGVGASSQVYGTAAGGASWWAVGDRNQRATHYFETSSAYPADFGAGGNGNTNNDGQLGGGGFILVEEYA